MNAAEPTVNPPRRRMKTKPFLRFFFPSGSPGIARRAALHLATACVILAGATVGLAGVLALSERLSFAPPPLKAYGWVSLHRYPKQQELFYFLLTMAGVPVWSWLTLRLWIAGSAWLARVARAPLNRVLWQNTVAGLCLLTPWPRLLRLDSSAGNALFRATVMMATLMLLFFLYNRFARAPVGPPAETDDVASQPEKALEIYASPSDRFGLLRKAWRIGRAVVVYAAVPALLFLLRYQNNLDGPLDLFHEGEFLQPLDVLLRGGVPYRDVYLQHGLFHNAWIPALGARLFSPTVAGVRAMRRLLDPLGGVTLYFLVLSLFRGRAGAGIVIGWLICGAVRVPVRASFGLIALACVAAAIPDPYTPLGAGPQGVGRLRRRALGWLFAAGICAMLAFWHSVEVGLYTMASAGLFLAAVGFLPPGLPARRRPLPLIAYAAGLVVGSWSIGGYFWAHGAMKDLLHNVYVQCAHHLQTWGLPFPALRAALDTLRSGPGFPVWPHRFTDGPVLWYLPPAVFLSANLYLVWRAARGGFWRSPTCVRLLLLLLAAHSFFYSVLGRSDSPHLHYGVLFMILVAFYLPDQLLASGLERMLRRGTSWRRRLAGALPVLLGALVAWPMCRYAVAAYRPTDGLIAGWRRWRDASPATRAESQSLPRLGRMEIPWQQSYRLRALVNAIHAYTADDETVYDFTNRAGILFLADRRCATRYFHAAYASTDALQREVIADLERQRTPLVLAPGPAGPHGMDGLSQAERHPRLNAYLESTYQTAAVVHGVRFLIRRGDDRRRPILPRRG